MSSIVSDKKKLTSNNNRYNTTLTAGSTYTGTAEISLANQVMVNLLSTQAGTLYIDIGPNNNNWNTYEYTVSANTFINEIITTAYQYYRLRFTNTSSSDATVIINSYFGDFESTSATQLDTVLNNNHQAINTKSILHTQHLDGNYLPVQSYFNHAVNVSLLNPMSAFGELLVANLKPEVQLQFSYYAGNVTTNNMYNIFRNNSSKAIVKDSNLVMASGCNYGDYSILQSKKFIKYNSGQGVRLRGSVLFSPLREGHQQAFGFGDKANGFFLYNSGSNFSCLKRTGGAYETYKLALTGTSATSDGTITIVLNTQTDYVLVSNGDTNIQIVNNIVNNPTINWIDLGWETYREGNSIYFKAINPMPMSGTFSFTSTATGITGTMTEITVGSTYTEDEIIQTNWDDKCDNSTFLPNIDFTLGNVLEINFQWLGYGKIQYNLENPNNGFFQGIYTFDYANTSGRPTIENPNGYLIAGSQNTTADKVATFTTGDIDTNDNTITISGGHNFVSEEFVCYDNNSNNGTVPTTFTRTFDGSDNSVILVDGQNCIVIPNHTLKNGEQVIYSNGGGGTIAGLADDTIYYVIYRDDDIIQLATSLANVSTYTSVSITGVGTGTSHTLSSFRYYIHRVDDTTVQLKEHFNDVAAISLSATGTRLLKLHNCYVLHIDGSTVSSGTTISRTNHGLFVYDCVKYHNYSGGTDISGLVNDDLYYVNVIDDDTFSLSEFKKETQLL